MRIPKTKVLGGKNTVAVTEAINEARGEDITPEEIITDNEKELCSEMFREMCRRRGIKHRRSLCLHLMKVSVSRCLPSNLRLGGSYRCYPQPPYRLVDLVVLGVSVQYPRLFSKDMASNIAFSTRDWMYASIVGVIPMSFRSI
jgi:hypothetical protein